MKTAHKKTQRQVAMETARQFETDHGVRGGFETQAMANQYAALQMAAWGDNLVYLGADLRDGVWHPEFNLFD